MKNLIYIALLLPLLSFGQFDTMLLASQQQFANEGGALDSGLYTFNDALSEPGVETNSLGAWASDGILDTNYSFVVSTDSNGGSWSGKVAAITATYDGPILQFFVTTGDTYDLFIDVKSSNAAEDGAGNANVYITGGGATIDDNETSTTWVSKVFNLTVGGSGVIQLILYPSFNATAGNKGWFDNIRMVKTN